MTHWRQFTLYIKHQSQFKQSIILIILSFSDHRAVSIQYRHILPQNQKIDGKINKYFVTINVHISIIIKTVYIIY